MLIDSFQRRIEYVRLSVMDKCNMRCFYCMPERHRDFEHPEHWLTFDEIERVISLFAELGVGRIRVTGGEPLLRKQLPDLISRLHAIDGIDDLSLSTNAYLLERHARELVGAGLGRINVSLDTLKPDRFRDITGAELQPVLDGLASARDCGLSPVKINMVAMKGVNDDEFDDMVAYCIDNGFTLRLIETMPMGDTGRRASEHYLDLQGVRQQLSERFDLVPGIMAGGGPARYMRSRDGNFRVGFITPISQHFCETCNRVRLSVEGTLYMCLGQEDRVELRPLLRSGADDETLREAILGGIARKPEKHEFRQKPEHVVRFMSMTGG